MHPRRAQTTLPPSRGPLRRYWLAWLFAFAVLTTLTVYFSSYYDTIDSAEVALVQRGTAVQSVYGTVDVVPITEIIVRARNAGMLSAVNIKAGDEVKVGQALVATSDESIQRQIDSANSALAQAKVRQALGPATAGALNNQEIEVDKVKNLLEVNDISPVNYQKEQNYLASLREEVQREILALNTDVENAQRARDTIEDQQSHNQITAPMDGIVLDLYCSLGEYVLPQTEICRIGSSKTQIVARVNEEDVGNLVPGMKANIRLYAYHDRDLSCTLQEVLPQAQNQVYEIIFSFDDPPALLLPGMTGEMNVTIGERRNTLVVPSRAVRHGNVVLAVVNGRVKKIVVQTGYRTLERTEILEGLSEGDQVILSNQDLYRSGVRVRNLKVKQA